MNYVQLFKDGGILQDGPAGEGADQVPLPPAGRGRLQHSQDWPGQEPEAAGHTCFTDSSLLCYLLVT